MRYYIASPFFDEASQNWVKAKEDEFKGFGIPFFSPRQDGVNFHEQGLTPRLRSERIKGIFRNNIVQLDSCDKIVCNLNFCKGRVDIGTLFELGYFVGNTNSNPFQDSQCFIDGDQAVLNEARRICGELKITVTEEVNNNSVIWYSELQDFSLIEESITFWNLEHIDVQSVTESISRARLELSKDNNIILLDDFPTETIILLGWLHSKGIPYYTCSFRGFGSNVMIAASSKGHMQIPAFVDDTYRENLL